MQVKDQVIAHLRRATREPTDKLNILTGIAHERYESYLSKTGHNFYAYRHPTFKGDAGSWNEQYAPIPKNYFLLNKNLGEHQIPVDLNIDLIFSQHKYSQFQVLEPISAANGLPHIHLEHTWPVNFTQHQINDWLKMRAHVNVFISDRSREAWGWKPEDSHVIYHGVDTQLFKPNPKIDRDMKPLSVVNDWKNRDIPCGFSFWQEAVADIESGMKVLGDTPCISVAANNIQELIEWYNKSYIFLNTSLQSPFPYSLYEAMACGCCCITTATCAIPDVIKHKQNGLLINTPQEMNAAIKQCQNDKSMCKELGRAARKTILDHFTLDKFVDNWRKVFNSLK